MTTEDIIEETPMDVDIETFIEQLPKVDISSTEDEKLQDEISQLLSPVVPNDKPTIDSLDDAVERDENGKLRFIVEPGQKVIIERMTMQAGDGQIRWLDTETYLVVSVDQDTGVLRLTNLSLRCAAMSNFITGLERGYRFKIPGRTGGNVGKRRRGRPRKWREPAEPRTTPEQPVVKRGRGRPKGSKNRDKETIAREKAERTAKRQAKWQKREARRRGVKG